MQQRAVSHCESIAFVSLLVQSIPSKCEKRHLLYLFCERIVDTSCTADSEAAFFGFEVALSSGSSSAAYQQKKKRRRETDQKREGKWKDKLYYHFLRFLFRFLLLLFDHFMIADFSLRGFIMLFLFHIIRLHLLLLPRHSITTCSTRPHALWTEPKNTVISQENSTPNRFFVFYLTNLLMECAAAEG